jgi:hypothetical protein
MLSGAKRTSGSGDPPVVELHLVADVEGVARLAGPHPGRLEHGDGRVRFGVSSLDEGLAHQVTLGVYGATGDLADHVPL